jgi:hypothetical protein
LDITTNIHVTSLRIKTSEWPVTFTANTNYISWGWILILNFLMNELKYPLYKYVTTHIVITWIFLSVINLSSCKWGGAGHIYYLYFRSERNNYNMVWFMVFNATFNKIIVEASFIGGGNRWKSPICPQSPTNYNMCCHIFIHWK